MSTSKLSQKTSGGKSGVNVSLKNGKPRLVKVPDVPSAALAIMSIGKRRVRHRRRKVAAPVVHVLKKETKFTKAASMDSLERAARTNALKVLKYITEPDTLDELEFTTNRPVVPNAIAEDRFPTFAFAEGSVTLTNNNLLFQLPSQTLYAARIASVGSGAQSVVGELLALNMGRADFAWLLTDVGLTTVPTTAGLLTLPLIPAESSGYIIGCETGPVQTPGLVAYSSATNYVRYMVTDGLGNYGIVEQPYPVHFRAVVIADVVIATNAGSNVTVYPISTFQTGGLNCTVRALFPTSGALIRGVLQLVGFAAQTPGDQEYLPTYTVASNLEIMSLASALVNKFAVQAFSFSAGREGPFNSTAIVANNWTTSAYGPSRTALETRCRQHSMGEINPDNEDWSSAKFCTRLTNPLFIDDPPLVPDFSKSNTTGGDQTVSSTAYLPFQTTTTAQHLVNPDPAAWANTLNGTIAYIETTGLSGTTVPFEYRYTVWREALASSATGLDVKCGQFYPEFTNWMAMVATLPTMARAHSFKDYIGGLWSRIKSGLGVVGRTAAEGAVRLAKNVAIDAATAIALGL